MESNLGMKLGDQLRAQRPDNLDFVVPVPNSGLYYAMGLSHAAGIPYLQALVKPCGSKRTLPESDLEKRGQMIEQSITLLPNLIQGKRVVLVDEAIFTGTTLRLVCGKLRRCGAAGIYICIPTSPCVSPCPLLPQKSLLAQRLSPEELTKFIAAVRHGDYCGGVQDLINLSYPCNLEQYTLLPEVQTYEDYGRYLVDSRRDFSLPKEARFYFDYAEYGETTAIDENGDLTPQGYIFHHRSATFQEIYDGKEIPQEYKVFQYPPRVKVKRLNPKHGRESPRHKRQ